MGSEVYNVMLVAGLFTLCEVHFENQTRFSQLYYDDTDMSW